MSGITNSKDATERKEAILAILRVDQLSRGELVRRTGLPVRQVKHCLEILNRNNLIERVGAGRDIRWRLSTITTGGIDDEQAGYYNSKESDTGGTIYTPGCDWKPGSGLGRSLEHNQRKVSSIMY